MAQWCNFDNGVEPKARFRSFLDIFLWNETIRHEKDDRYAHTINPRTGGGVDFNPPPRKVFRR